MIKRGLTLVELIAVVAVIGLLIAISTPVLYSCRNKAKAVVCGSNIRQIDFAISTYHGEAGTLPCGFAHCPVVPPGGYAGDSAQDWTGWWWFNYIGQFYDQRYTKTSILFCPAKNLKGTTLEANILCGNYGVNQSVCRATSGGTDAEFVGQSLRMGEIPRPSETLLTVDAGYVLVNWWHATADPPQPLDPTYIGNTSYVPGLRINSAKDIWPRQEYDAINGRHPNKTVNAGFVDGHVENKKADALLVEKHQDEYYNRVPLWSPK